MTGLGVIVIIVGGGMIVYEAVRLLPRLWDKFIIWLFGRRKGY